MTGGSGTQSTALVSIIIPVHNVAQFLEQCLSSVADQTYTNVEVFLVDDASADGSTEICRLWSSKDRRFTLVDAVGRGASAARNTGLLAARGEFVTFVDSDDMIAPTFIADLVTAAQGRAADVALCGFSRFEQEHPTFPAVDETPSWSTLDSRDALHRVICRKPRWEVWGKLYRTELWRHVQMPEGMVHQDLAVIPIVLSRARTVAWTDAPLYAYRERTGSTMDQVRRVQISTDLLDILDRNITFARRQPAMSRDVDDFEAAYLLHASRHVERLDWRALRRNWTFIDAYRSFATRHRRRVLQNPKIRPGYRVLWVLSSVSPTAFWVLTHGRRALIRRPQRTVDPWGPGESSPS